MKVVLFCGGMGMRLREYSDTIPKPMVPIGYRPILWNVMKYYAHYGFKKFILCLGYRGDAIKQYFINYHEYLSNDFTLAKGGKELTLYNNDIEDWEITFVDTGLASNIGQRLKAVEKYLADEEMFMANYSDGLTDFPLPRLVDFFIKSEKTACLLSIRPNQSYHMISSREEGVGGGINGVQRSDIWVNGGYFIFKKDIFKYLRDGEELVHAPFNRMIEGNELITYKYDGFWVSMDTFKDKQLLDDMYHKGDTPWEVWKENDTQKITICNGKLKEVSL